MLLVNFFVLLEIRHLVRVVFLRRRAHADSSACRDSALIRQTARHVAGGNLFVKTHNQEAALRIYMNSSGMCACAKAAAWREEYCNWTTKVMLLQGWHTKKKKILWQQVCECCSMLHNSAVCALIVYSMLQICWTCWAFPWDLRHQQRGYFL